MAIETETECVTLRKATAEDSRPVFEWRNHEQTRRFIFDPAEIPWESHENWFNQTLENPRRHLLIGEVNNLPVGVLRFDLETDGQCTHALVSVYVVPGQEGQGYGARLLRAGSDWLKAHSPLVEYVVAQILPENGASIRAFEKAGYEEYAREYRYKLSKDTEAEGARS